MLMMRKRKKKRSPLKIIGFLLLSLLVLAAGGLFYVYSELQPVDTTSTEEIEVEIPMGSGVRAIGDILEDNGIINSSTLFALYTRLTGTSSFQAGTYVFTPAMTNEEIMHMLESGPSAVHVITIPEGTQIEEIAVIVEDTFDIPQADFLAKVNDASFLRGLQEQFPNILTEDIFQDGLRYALEGYLFPSTYHFYQQEVTLDMLITRMIQQTSDVLMPLTEAREALGLSVHELLTMSSIIEEEATELSDRKTIASVFYNRLEIGMKLQTDPTVLYAHGMHKERVLYGHLEIDSPFNTYRNPGLPIGPIANAGIESITAALEPKDTDYLFFLADQHGVNYFSKTYEEHLQLREEHINSVWREQDAANE